MHRFEGNWKENLMHGHGTFSRGDGTSYVGAFHLGEPTRGFLKGVREGGREREGEGGRETLLANTYQHGVSHTKGARAHTHTHTHTHKQRQKIDTAVTM